MGTVVNGEGDCAMDVAPDMPAPFGNLGSPSGTVALGDDLPADTDPSEVCSDHARSPRTRQRRHGQLRGLGWSDSPKRGSNENNGLQRDGRVSRSQWQLFGPEWQLYQAPDTSQMAATIIR